MQQQLFGESLTINAFKKGAVYQFTCGTYRLCTGIQNGVASFHNCNKNGVVLLQNGQPIPYHQRIIEGNNQYTLIEQHAN